MGRIIIAAMPYKMRAKPQQRNRKTLARISISSTPLQVLWI
jgi:hypothetical protein